MGRSSITWRRLLPSQKRWRKSYEKCGCRRKTAPHSSNCPGRDGNAQRCLAALFRTAKRAAAPVAASRLACPESCVAGHQPSVLDLFSLARCLARFSFFLASLTSANLSCEAGCFKSAFVLSAAAFVLASSTATMFIISPLVVPCKRTRNEGPRSEHFCSDKIQDNPVLN